MVVFIFASFWYVFIEAIGPLESDDFWWRLEISRAWNIFFLVMLKASAAEDLPQVLVLQTFPPIPYLALLNIYGCYSRDFFFPQSALN